MERRKQKEQLIEKTIELWQPFYPDKLTREDAIEIIENIKTYLSILIDWQEKENKSVLLKKSILEKNANVT